MTFRAVSERTVHTGYVLDVCVGTFAAPDGTSFERDVVHHPGAVAILAVEDDHLWMVRQYRPALDAFFLEIPAGLRDVPEEPTVTLPDVSCAKRLVSKLGRWSSS